MVLEVYLVYSSDLSETLTLTLDEGEALRITYSSNPRTSETSATSQRVDAFLDEVSHH